MNTDKIYAEKIASEYAPKSQRKVVALKKLDRKAKLGANVFAYTFGSIMTLVLGVSMCLSLHVIGNNELWQLILGYVLGVVAIICLSINYPIYKKILERGKIKYGNDIIKLANEIVEND